MKSALVLLLSLLAPVLLALPISSDQVDAAGDDGPCPPTPNHLSTPCPVPPTVDPTEKLPKCDDSSLIHGSKCRWN
jgi:hypothetical protein